MKLINKLVAVAIALLAMVAVSACSSEEPNNAFKGNVDGNFIESLARGETSITFNLVESKEYEMDYEAYKNGTGKWGAMKEYDRPSFSGISGLTIHNGKSWRPVKQYQFGTGCPSPLFDVWTIYGELKDMVKDVYVSCPIEFNVEKNTFTVENVVYNIEKATDKELVLSNEGILYMSNNQNELEPYSATKYILFYNKAAMELPDIETCIYSDSETNAKLEMVRILREFFGDEVNLNHYHNNMLTYPIVDLKKIEEHLCNGKDEFEKDVLREASK